MAAETQGAPDTRPMAPFDDLGTWDLALLGLLLAVAWVIYGLKLRRDGAAGGGEVDRYLRRTDLAAGARPRNAAEWVISLVNTRLPLVFGVLVGASLLGLLVGILLDDDVLTVTFVVVGSMFALAAAFFLGVAHLEARLPGGGR